MNDLQMVEQYFLRELTEAEEQVLDELLEVSPDAAELFQEKAKAAYLRYGLPEPSLPPQGPTSAPSSKAFKWLWILAGAGLLSGLSWGLWKSRSFSWPWNSPEPMSIATPVETTMKPVLAKIAKVSQPSQVTSSATQGHVPAHAPVAQSLSPQEAGKNPNMPHPLPAASAPLSGSADGDSPGHSGLRVVVERQTPGLVTVSVLNQQGEEVRALYAGILKPGRWAFEWNGRLSNGSRVPIGTYFIQVKSGSTVQKQVVLIDK